MESNGLHMVNTSHMHYVQTGLHKFNTVWTENSEHFVLISSHLKFVPALPAILEKEIFLSMQASPPCNGRREKLKASEKLQIFLQSASSDGVTELPMDQHH